MSEIKVEIPCSSCEAIIENIKIRFEPGSDCLEITGRCLVCKTEISIPMKIGVPVGSAVLR